MRNIICLGLLLILCSCTTLSATMSDGTTFSYTSFYRDIKDIKANIGGNKIAVGEAAVSDRTPAASDIISTATGVWK